MQICTQNPVLFDSDSFMYASGRRYKPKKRYGVNKAVGYIPAVAIGRYAYDRKKARDKEERRAARAERRERRRARREGRELPPERPTSRRRPTPRTARPTPRTSRETEYRGTTPSNQVELTPLPEGLTPKQGVMAADIAKQQQQRTNMIYIVGGIALVGIIGYLLIRKK